MVSMHRCLQFTRSLTPRSTNDASQLLKAESAAQSQVVTSFLFFLGGGGGGGGEGEGEGKREGRSEMVV